MLRQVWSITKENFTISSVNETFSKVMSLNKLDLEVVEYIVLFQYPSQEDRSLANKAFMLHYNTISYAHYKIKLELSSKFILVKCGAELLTAFSQVTLKSLHSCDFTL